MNAPLRTYRPPTAGTQNHRCSATTRVTPFAHLHIGSFANSTYNSSPITHNSSHSFSAKERDAETGLSYFGSRYYSADLSIWLSVDPMSGKYPYQSNYVYCSNNPLKVIDPNGEDEWQLNTENGNFTRIGNKGGATIDYYSIGTVDEKGVFQESSNCSINRDGKCNINSFRIKESKNSTLSAFHIPDAKEGEVKSGFILERNGPDAEESGQARRIPAGSYGLTSNKGSKYPGNPRLYKESERNGNDFGSFSTRGILIHIGNNYVDGVGCLLPGSSFSQNNGDYAVWKSDPKVNGITSLCKSRGWNNMRINIVNAIK